MTQDRPDYKDRIIVALDVDSLAAAKELVNRLGGLIKVFKVGSQLFTVCGPEVIKMITGKGKRVFLDLKFHDIPNTVARAAEAALEQRVFMFNLHAGGGREMMTAAVKAVGKKTSGSSESGAVRPLILGVTVLTSFNQTDLEDSGINRSVSAQVLYLARRAKEAGLDGVVCSPQEIELIRRNMGDDFVIVSPGIRPDWSEPDDQKRIMTPKEAFEKGADYIVIGRPITAAPDPAEAVRRILSELE